MPTSRARRFYVIAERKDGTPAYVANRRRCREHFTMRRNQAVGHASREEAEEHASRLNGVAAQGHYWQEVAYFRPGV